MVMLRATIAPHDQQIGMTVIDLFEDSGCGIMSVCGTIMDFGAIVAGDAGCCLEQQRGLRKRIQRNQEMLKHIYHPLSLTETHLQQNVDHLDWCLNAVWIHDPCLCSVQYYTLLGSQSAYISH